MIIKIRVLLKGIKDQSLRRGRMFKYPVDLSKATVYVTANMMKLKIATENEHKREHQNR
jgi:hypothetical protein